jgi:ABC-type branched-subunit amino acid transport system substrate-binding protein
MYDNGSMLWGARIIFASILFVCGSAGYSQDWTSVKVNPERDNDFKKALILYKSAEYKSALTAFEALATSRQLHQRTTAALLMTGKCLERLSRFSEAIPHYDKLIATFPKSGYVDDAVFSRASAHYRLEQFSSAAKDFLWVSDWSHQTALATKSATLATKIIRAKLSLAETRSLLPVANAQNSAAIVTVELARKEIAEGLPDRAEALLKDYKRKYDSKKHIPTIDQLMKETGSPISRSLKVGVILPLTGFYAEEGQGILRGIKFAQQYNKNSLAIPLVVEDSESNLIKAIQEIKRLIEVEKVTAVIGELESEITAGIGALASREGTPVIGPAATENDVAAVGDNIYQLNSNLERKGEAIAQYAFEILGLRTFATLAPADEYGQQMTNSFTSKVDQLGGRILAQGWYYGNPEDLSRQFKAIREAAFAFDSTDVAGLIAEAEDKGQDLDEKDIPVHSIDGIFFPIYADHIKYVGPQFALNNIRAQILGGEYWDNLEALQAPQVQRYVDGVVFVSDYFPDEQNAEFRDFRTEFRLKMKRTPERWEVFGYDAFKLLSELIKGGARTSRQINEALDNLTAYEGVKGKISFKANNRVNKEVNFLQFLNGRIVKQEISR